MTYNKNKLKQVRDALADSKSEFWDEWHSNMSEGDFENHWLIMDINKAIITLDRLSAPVGVKKIEGLEEACKWMDTFILEKFGSIDDLDKDGCLIRVRKAARAYLELQNGVSVAPNSEQYQTVPISTVTDGYKLVPMSLIEQRLAVAYGRGKGANRTYRPKIGERCLVSPPNCDDDNGYVFQEYNILWSNDIFVLYGNDGYYPNMDKWEHIIAKPLSAAPTPEQTEIDLDAIKREILETVTHNIQKVGAKYIVHVVDDIIDHLAATGRLKV